MWEVGGKGSEGCLVVMVREASEESSADGGGLDKGRESPQFVYMCV